MAENKEFYLVIKGEKIIVSEEVYRAYKSSDRAERKRKQRMWRCRTGGIATAFTRLWQEISRTWN